MTHTDNLIIGPIRNSSLGLRMLLGAGIALMLIAFFLFMAGEGNPEWPRFWRLRPLLVVPFAGAIGGLFYHLMDYFRYQGGWKMILANVLSLIVYIIGLWLGSVLGLVGTMWH